MEKQQSPSEQERAPTTRWALWTLLAVAVIIGVVLFFIFGRGVPSVL